MTDHILLTWMLKSHTKWALNGDQNTKYFHTLASGRKNQNTIWSLLNEEGTAVKDELGFKELGCKHFAKIFCDDNQTNLLAQLKVAMLYPIMISPMDAPCLTKPVSIAEIECALHSFKKDRSPGPDG